MEYHREKSGVGSEGEPTVRLQRDVLQPRNSKKPIGWWEKMGCIASTDSFKKNSKKEGGGAWLARRTVRSQTNGRCNDGTLVVLSGGTGVE